MKLFLKLSPTRTLTQCGQSGVLSQKSNLVERAAVEACEPKVIGDSRCYGRGCASEVRKVWVGKIHDEDLKVVPDEDRRALHKLLNLLRGTASHSK